jgi:hypothetical protein
VKAAGVYAQATAACLAKAVAKGVETDAVCLAKAEVKLGKAFDKADKNEDCLAGDGEESVAIGAAAYLDALDAALFTVERCCAFVVDAVLFACRWEPSAESCEAAAGSVGEPGSVCDGSGTCSAAPANGGACCDTEAGCMGGALFPDSCNAIGGTFSVNAVCLPTGACAAAP